MHRVLLAVVCGLTLVEPAWAVRGSRCRPAPCSPQAVAVARTQPSPGGNATSGSYVDPCYCRKEAIDTYSIGGGQFESRYLAERHDDGCPPVGDCQAPVTITLTEPAGLPEQECSLDQCEYRMGLDKSRNSNKGLVEPVDPGYMPVFPGRLGQIAEIIHTDFLVFSSAPQGWVRAKVFIVKLPKSIEIRPGKPVRMLAIGYEVKTVLPTAYEVERRDVQQCELNECQFFIDVGDVTYAVITAK